MTKIYLLVLWFWKFGFLRVCGIKRNLYFPDYYHSFNTSNSQIIGVFSSDCKYLKDFLTNTPIFTNNDSNIVDKCVEVVNPLYSALTDKSLKYDVYQHFVYYTLTQVEIHQYRHQQDGNATLNYNLINNNESLVYHLFLYNVSNYTHSSKSLKFWMNKLSNSRHFLKKINHSQMTICGFHSNTSYIQSLVSNSIVFYVNDISRDGDKTNSFMYSQCGATIRINMDFTKLKHNEFVKENQTVFITYSSDVTGLPNQQIVK